MLVPHVRKRGDPDKPFGARPILGDHRPLPPDGEPLGVKACGNVGCAAAAKGHDEAHRSLLQATVEVARAIFGAKAASVFLLDEEADELVFEAVAGEGEDELIGMRFPSGTGIAGWVLTTRSSRSRPSGRGRS